MTWRGRGQSIIMSQVVPRPNAVANDVVKRYQDDLAALGSSAHFGFTSLEGYIAGRVAIEATRLAAKGGGVGRARFRDALSDLDVDLGGYRVRFAPPSPHRLALRRRGRHRPQRPHHRLKLVSRRPSESVPHGCLSRPRGKKQTTTTPFLREIDTMKLSKAHSMHCIGLVCRCLDALGCPGAGARTSA